MLYSCEPLDCRDPHFPRIFKLTIANNLVAGLALDVASKADTTSILFEAWVIETPSFMSTKNPGQWHYTGGEYALLHRQSARPGIIVLCLVLIRMINLRFGLGMYLSIVKVRSQAHARRPFLGHSRWRGGYQRIGEGSLRRGRTCGLIRFGGAAAPLGRTRNLWVAKQIN